MISIASVPVLFRMLQQERVDISECIVEGYTMKWFVGDKIYAIEWHTKGVSAVLYNKSEV